MPALVLVVLGFPLLALVSLWEKRNQLQARDTRLQLGFLFKGYRLRAYYWEPLAIFRKLAVAALAVFVPAAKVQAFLLLALLMACALASARIRPFRAPALNRLEVLSFTALSLSVFAACFFLSALDPASPAFNQGRDCRPSFLLT